MIRRVVVGNLLVAVAYIVAGRLALLLAIPPGYATAVWPAAGVALVGALRLGPAASVVGVGLGSFVVNAWTALAAPSASTVQVALVPAAIGVGAALQALVGASLLGRTVAAPLTLDRDRDIVRFHLLGGPVACLVSPTVGVATLVLTGLLPLGAAGFAWWTWWVGDTVGALVFAPILLAWLGRPEAAWRPRRLSVAVPLVLGFVLLTALFVRASGWERERLHGELSRRGVAVERALSRATDRYLDANATVAALYRTYPEVSAAEFTEFSHALLARHPGLRALSWSRRVTAAERPSYEASTGVRITEVVDERRVPAAARAEYVPVDRIVPIDGNRAALGFDLASEPLRRATLDSAQTTRDGAASPPITLVQDGQPSGGFLLLAAVMRGATLTGYASAVVRYHDLVEEALVDVERHHLVIVVADEGAVGEPASGAPQVVYGEPTALEGVPWDSFVEVGGRRWHLQVSVAPGYSPRSWSAWAVLAVGLAFVAVLGAVLLLVTGRTTRTAAVEREQRFLLETADAVRGSTSPEDVFEKVAHRVGIYLDVDRCFFNTVDLVADTMTIHPGYSRIEPMRGTLPLGGYSSATQAALRAGLTVVVEDSARDPRTAERYPSAYAPLGLRALVGVPLLVDGAWSASLWVSDQRPRVWSSSEVALVQSVAERAWVWIGQLRLTRDLALRTRELEGLVREKDVLVREIHHRVKNNLQVISSLLHMQAASSDDPRVASALEESRERVQSIALVHAQLYRGAADPASIALGGYLEELVRALDRGQRSGQVSLVVEPSTLTLPLDQAVACGLVVNELVTNALKHAFPGGRAGTVTIAAEDDPDGQARVTVRDDGVGLPPGFDPEAAGRAGLGMIVITTLAGQLGGTLTVGAGPGTTFELRFPRAD